MADSLSDLELKVTSYKHQLQQIILILISDPRNESFLKLKDDLERLITLTENLISVRRSELIAEKISEDVYSAATQKEDSRASTHHAVVSSSQSESGSSSNQVHSSLGTAQLSSTSSNRLSNCPFFIGDAVEAVSGERPFPAVVIGILPDSQECTIKYFEFETPVNVLFSDLRKIAPGALTGQEVSVGLKCQGKNNVKASCLQLKYTLS